MRNKGFVTVGFLSFGLGALLAFIFDVDAENVTILSVAAIAGLLSYMTIFMTEENKNNENLLSGINVATWAYLRNVEEYSHSIMMKLVVLRDVRENEKEIDLILQEDTELQRSESVIKKMDEWKEGTKNHFETKEEYIQKEILCTSKGKEVVDLIAMYEVIYKEAYQNCLNKLKDEVVNLNKYIRLYGRMNNLYAEEKLLSLEDFVIDNIESGMKDVRKYLIDLKAISEKSVLEKKRGVFQFIFIIVLTCLGYLVSESYKIT